jgi:hypothetical protein
MSHLVEVQEGHRRLLYAPLHAHLHGFPWMHHQPGGDTAYRRRADHVLE